MDDDNSLEEKFKFNIIDVNNFSRVFITYAPAEPHSILPQYKGRWNLLKEWNLLPLFPTFCGKFWFDLSIKNNFFYIIYL